MHIFVTATKLLPPVGTGHLLVYLIMGIMVIMVIMGIMVIIGIDVLLFVIVCTPQSFATNIPYRPFLQSTLLFPVLYFSGPNYYRICLSEKSNFGNFILYLTPNIKYSTG